MTRLPPALGQRVTMLVAQNPPRLHSRRHDRAARLCPRRRCMQFLRVRHDDSCCGHRGQRPIDGVQLIQQCFAFRAQQARGVVEIDYPHFVIIARRAGSESARALLRQSGSAKGLPRRRIRPHQPQARLPVRVHEHPRYRAATFSNRSASTSRYHVHPSLCPRPISSSGTLA